MASKAGAAGVKSNETNSSSAEFGGYEIVNRVVDVSTLRSHPSNTYEIDEDDVERLAENIREVGLLHPPLVREVDDGGLQIISGHRRVRALRLLAKTDPSYAKVEVRVAVGMSDYEAVVALHSGNLQSRALSAKERDRQTDLLVERCEQLRQEYPERYRGVRTNEIIASLLGVTYSSYRRQTEISKNLIPDLVPLWSDGILSQNLAIEICHQDPKLQKKAYKALTKSGAKTSKEANLVWQDITEGLSKKMDRYESALKEADAALFKLRDCLSKNSSAQIPVDRLEKLRRDTVKVTRILDAMIADAKGEEYDD